MTQRTHTRRRGWARWLMLALLVVPVIEVFIILQVGHAIGGWQTFGLLILWSALGAWIVKREAGRAFGALRQAFSTGRMPTRELSDAALVLVGGTLLLAPGFLTDVLGLFVLLPFTRPLTRRVLERAVAARLFGGAVGSFSSFGAGPFGSTRTSQYQVWTSTPESEGAEHGRSGPFGRARSRTRRTEDVIEGEIID